MLPYEIKTCSGRYADEFIKLKCAPDMINLKLFPNFKEITESFSAYNAARKYLWKIGYEPNDPTIWCFIVGDGSTPRTAATFAFRTKWHCVSIDPVLNDKEYEHKIDRLLLIRDKIENVKLGAVDNEKAVIIAVHSHAPLGIAVKNIQFKEKAVIAIPCCVKQELDKEPDIVYKDWGIWSPKNTVKIWRDV
jgi:hypothetical protein